MQKIPNLKFVIFDAEIAVEPLSKNDHERLCKCFR